MLIVFIYYVAVTFMWKSFVVQFPGGATGGARDEEGVSPSESPEEDKRRWCPPCLVSPPLIFQTTH